MINMATVYQSKNKEKVYLFSHGGIHSDFTETVYNILTDFVNRTDFNKTQKGGKMYSLDGIKFLNENVHKNILAFTGLKIF